MFTMSDIKTIARLCKECNSSFSTAFLESVAERLESGRELTLKQIVAVQNIMEGHHITEDDLL